MTINVTMPGAKLYEFCLPPVCMVVAQCDPLHDESIELKRRLRTVGEDVWSKTFPGTVHSFLEAVSISATAVQALDDTASWLRMHASCDQITRSLT